MVEDMVEVFRTLNPNTLAHVVSDALCEYNTEDITADIEKYNLRLEAQVTACIRVEECNFGLMYLLQNVIELNCPTKKV